MREIEYKPVKRGGGGGMRENANIGRQDAVIEMHALSYNVRRQELETIQKVLLSSRSAWEVLLTHSLTPIEL